MHRLFLILLIFLAFTFPCFAADNGVYPESLTDADVWFVVGPNGTGSQTGADWDNAYDDIGDASESNNMTPGDTIYVKGITVEDQVTFNVNDAGANIHPGPDADDSRSGDENEVETITLNGSVVTFATNPTESSGYNATHMSEGQYYVWVINSWKGNTGVFQVESVSGTAVTVDTSDLPEASFVTESSSPWGLKGAIIRPIRVIGCDSNGDARTEWPPTSGLTASNTRAAVNFYCGTTGSCPSTDYVYISYMKINKGSSQMQVVGSGDCDFHVWDHLESNDAVCWAIAYNQDEWGNGINGDHSYIVVQHSLFHRVEDCIGEIGYHKAEVIYNGGEVAGDDFAYCALMYTEFYGGDGCVNDTDTDAEVWDGRGDHDYTVIWGNYIHDYHGGMYGIIRPGNGHQLIANNYFVDNHAGAYRSEESECVLTDGFADYLYVFNNILYNNETDAGYQFCVGWDGSNQDFNFWNNIVVGPSDNSEGGMGRIWNDESIEMFHNNIFMSLGTVFESYVTYSSENTNIYYDYVSLNRSPSGTYYTSDPGLGTPPDFSIGASSFAKDKGTDLSAYFQVDNHNAATPSTLPGTQPEIRTGSWDIGVYEYQDESPPPVSGGYSGVTIGGILK